MAHHNAADCDACPCKPGPPAGHHPAASEYDEDDQTAGESRVTLIAPRKIPRENDQ